MFVPFSVFSADSMSMKRMFAVSQAISQRKEGGNTFCSASTCFEELLKSSGEIGVMAWKICGGDVEGSLD